MKSLIIKIAILTAIMFGLSGCGQKFTEDRLLINSNSTLKDNVKTKVYYKDFSEELIIESNKKLVEDLNKSEIIPVKWYTLTNPKEVSSTNNTMFSWVRNDLRKKVEGGKFKLSSDGTKVVFEKQYTNLSTQLEEIEIINNYLNVAFLTKSIDGSYEYSTAIETRNKYLTATIYFDKESSNMNQLVFFTKYSFFHNLVKNDIKKQIELGGWEIVDNPEKADKEIYFELSRDYFPAELKYLRKNKKGINFVSLNPGNKFNIQGKSNGDNIVVGQSAMNLASASNGDLTSVAIGLTTAAIFSLFGDSTPEKEYSGAFVSLKIIDKVKKNVSIKLYDSYLDNYKVDTRYDLLKKINETINIDPDSKKYNIN